MTFIQMAKRFLGENIGSSPVQTGIIKIDEDKEKKFPKYRVGMKVQYRLKGKDYGIDTIGEIVKLSDNDVTIKTKDEKFLILSKHDVEPLGKEDVGLTKDEVKEIDNNAKKEESVEESVKYLNNLFQKVKF